MRRSKGFTLIELILVIAILGILAISALPKLLDVSTEAKQASRDGVIGAVRAGIALYRANDMITSGTGTGSYPATLDSASNAACGATNLCFTNVLSSGIDDPAWVKVSDTSYTFNDGKTTPLFTYTYGPTTGSFQ